MHSYRPGYATGRLLKYFVYFYEPESMSGPLAICDEVWQAAAITSYLNGGPRPGEVVLKFLKEGDH